MKHLLLATRLFVGILFILSGLVKANDPLGLAYKMDEYFAIWHWHWASQFSLPLSISMNMLEIVTGVALILGWAAGFMTRLLLGLIIFFTFLTGYAVITGTPKSCGCFGDCMPLLAWQSFAKDLILLVLIGFLYKYRLQIKPWLPLRANLFLVLLCTGFVFWGQLYALKNLPFIDCLPYAAGKDLLKQMQPPPGSLPDSTSIMFVYKKDGKELSFDADHFPADFDDKTYEYIDRKEVVVRKGNGEPAIKDFALFSTTGTDTTKAILGTQGPYLFFFAKDFSDGTPTWQEVFGKLYLKAKEKNIPIFVLTNQPNTANQWFNGSNRFNVPVLTCDGTVMKTILRTKVGIVAMTNATVAMKWSEDNMNGAVKWMNER